MSEEPPARGGEPVASDRDATPAPHRPSLRRRAPVWIGALLLILALALLPVWLGWDRGLGGPAAPGTDATPELTARPGAPTGAATAQPDTTPAPLPTPSPTRSPVPSPAPSPGRALTPIPETVAALTGSGAVTDPESDVLDEAGEPGQDPAAAADLVRVELTGREGELVVTWTVAGDVPSSVAGSLLWSVDLWSRDELAASVTVQQIGARRVAGVLDWSTGEQTDLAEGLEVSQGTIRLVVPMAALPRISPPVTWEALGQQDGGLEDRSPDSGRAELTD